MRHQVKAEGRCIDSAPTYVAGRIKHERAKYTEGDKYMSKKCTCSRDGVPSGYYWHDPACPVHNKNEGDRVGRAGLESSDCSAVTSKQTNNNQG